MFRGIYAAVNGADHFQRVRDLEEKATPTLTAARVADVAIYVIVGVAVIVAASLGGGGLLFYGRIVLASGALLLGAQIISE